MSKIRILTRFGNPVLREVTKALTVNEIKSHRIQQLIEDMYFTLQECQYGVGLAAPQVGELVALSVIGIKPTPTRPKLTPFKAVLINPEIVETYGRAVNLWEGCVSSGTHENTLFARVPRFTKIKLRWLDEHAIEHQEILDDFVAQVAQHEVDHLHGTLFVDKVTDTSTYMLADEYKKRIVKQ